MTVMKNKACNKTQINGCLLYWSCFAHTKSFHYTQSMKTLSANVKKQVYSNEIIIRQIRQFSAKLAT